MGDHAEEVRAAHVPPEDAEVARRLLSRLVRVHRRARSGCPRGRRRARCRCRAIS
ncbi:hypothetical protein [Streptomyces physcomitrii]|uniref:hypothetical protein n=1 Tax=Streptomyces physcomitrii TaxID=2724184 RepID=UPI0035E43726